MKYAPVNVLSAIMISGNDGVVSVVADGFPFKIAKIYISTPGSFWKYLPR